MFQALSNIPSPVQDPSAVLVPSACLVFNLNRSFVSSVAHYLTAMAAFLVVTTAHHRRLYTRGLIDFEDEEDEVEVVEGVE